MSITEQEHSSLVRRAEPELLDHFALFGIPRKLRVDAEKLEARFHTLQMASHPDKFAGGDAAAVLYAQDTSAAINRAYRTLRDPNQRLKYLLQLYGYSVEQSKAVPQSLLFSVMQAQEILEGLESVKTDAEKDQLRAELAQLGEQFEERIETLESERLSLIARWDGAQQHPTSRAELSAEDQALMASLVKLLAERAYIDTLSTSIQAAERGESAVIRH